MKSNNNLNIALCYLAKYLRENEIPEKEWLSFNMSVLLAQDNKIKFMKPNITLGIIEDDQLLSDDNKIIISDWFSVE